ncbi:MAG: Type-2 restriction enzyme MjaV [Methanoregulaceae archaeon PtaB.Bin056]|jgi:hypothetical protein|nr:MAG: Type-2 restriction enzyme MjaV [Methanoregulaceae archaeon PtaB.Bin056]
MRVNFVSQNPDTIQKIIQNAKNIAPISFCDIVKATTGRSIIPLNFESNEDQSLIKILTDSAKDFILSWDRRKQRFRGDRINEVGRAIEDAFVQELRKTTLKPEFLGKSGYPDIKIIDEKGRVTYLESKAISKGWDSGFRSFYYTDGKKITYDARHLLIAWNVTEERDKYWRVLGFKLCEISNLNTEIKIEFNSSNKELYKDNLIIGRFDLS